MAAVRHLGFLNMQIFTYRTVCGHDLHVPAKLRRNRLNVCGIIACFRFLIWRPSAILDSLYACADNQRSGIVGLYHRTKFGLNRLSSFDNIEV